MSRPPFYFPPEAALPREPAIADQGDGDNDSIFDECERCEGHGGWTETYYSPSSTGRDLEADVTCDECGGSGVS